MDKKKLLSILLAVILIVAVLTLSGCKPKKPDPTTTVPPTTVHVHTFDDGVVTKEATCAEDGLKVHTCTKCGETEETVLAATGEHTYGEGEVTKMPTTEEEGVMTYTCTVCEHVKEEAIPVLCAHEFDDGEVTKAPTCQAPGVRTHTCTKCGETSELEIPVDPDAHSHTVSEVIQAPTCVAEGLQKLKCQHCDHTVEQVMAATGVHTYDEGTITKEPTQESYGEKVYKCTGCGHTKVEQLPMLDKHKYDAGAVTKEPTCVTEGERTFTCTECGHKTVVKLPATGVHTYDEGTVTKAPTCAAEGEKTHKCLHCDSTKTSKVPMSKEHSYDKGTVTKEPTCSATGSKTFKCAHCGHTKTDAIPATGIHKYDEGKITKAPTCAASGEKVYTCADCKHTTKESIPATGKHEYDDGKVTKEPSCTASGVKTYTCKTCDKTKTETIKKLGHSLGEWVQILAPSISDEGLERATCTKCDYYEERTVEKLEAAYYITADEGNGKIIQIGVTKDGKYTLSTPEKIGYNFAGWVDASGKSFAASGKVSADVQISAKWELDGTDSLAELIERAAAGVDRINITKNITVTEPIFVVGNTTIYSDGNFSLTRDPNYAGDMFVIGHDKDGNSSVMLHRKAILTLGGGNGTLTIDGNRDNTKVKVLGTALFITESATVDLYDGIVLANHKKEGNERAYLWSHLMKNIDYAGGAAMQIVSGTVNMYGGVIENNIAVHEITTVTNPDGTTTKVGKNAYGGAIQNCGNFYMYGGVIRDNEANRGAGMYNWAHAKIYSGTFEGNKASAGGAIASSAHIYIGTESESYQSMGSNIVMFRNNVATSNGGAIYTGSGDAVLILGNTVFDGNKSEGANGGAIATSGPLTIRAAKFLNNSAANGGGAIYHYYNNPALILRVLNLHNSLFEGNFAGKGGAISLGASATAEAASIGTKANINNCQFTNNKAVAENGGSGNGGALYLAKFSTAYVNGGNFTGNTAANLGGAVNSTGQSKLTISNVVFSQNSSNSKGGAISAYGGTTLKVTGTSFQGNTSVTDSGSALYASGITFTMQDIVFTGNSTPASGTVALYSGAKLTLTSCVAEGNKARYGGVFFTDDATLIVQKGTNGVLEFKNNDASTGNGGFLCASGTSTADVSDAIISGNIAKKGGAIICGGGVTMNLTNVEFTGNKASSGVTTHGGGVLMVGAANVTIKDCKIEGNSSSVNAGAIFANSGAVVQISNTSIIGNTSGRYGGVIYGEGATISITGNSVVNGNSAKNGGAICLFSATGENEQKIRSNLTLENVTAKDNSASGNGGVLYTNGSDFAATNVKFQNNKANAVDYGGGVLYSSGSTGTMKNVEFTGNSADVGGVTDLRSESQLTISSCIVNGNSATQFGGAFYAKHSQLNLVEGEGDTIELTGNTAGTAGGAIYVCGNPTVNVAGALISGNEAGYGAALGAETYAKTDTITLTNVELTNNKSTTTADDFGGGAIYVEKAIVNLLNSSVTGNTAVNRGGAAMIKATATFHVENTTFADNTAAANGGALYVSLASTVTADNTIFEANSANKGGSLYVHESSLSITGGSLKNHNNEGTSDGAVVYIWASNLFDVTNVEIKDNTSYGNGVLYIHSVPATFDNVTATGNTATNGGVAYMSTNAVVTVKNSNWYANTATSSGGTMYLGKGTLRVINSTLGGDAAEKGNTAKYGGAIFAKTNKTVTIENAVLANNTASSTGGAVYVQGGTVNVTGTGNRFVSNSSGSTGGAFNVIAGEDSEGNKEPAVISINGAEFTSNTTVADGGAVYISGSELNVTNSSFTKNSTASDERGGGVMYCTGATVNMDAVTVTENSASWGGAFNIRTNSVVTVTSGTVSNNTAGLLGGAIYVKHATLNMVAADGETIEMSGNKATTAGGAIYACGNPTVNVTNATLSGNEAGYGGAVAAEAYATTDSITFTNCTLSNNVSTVDSDEQGGGAIYVDTAILNLIDSSCTGNTAVKRGGAIYAVTSATVNVEGSTFDSNVAGKRGGAICAVGATAVNVDATGFAKNQGSEYAAAFLASEVGSVTWTGNTSFSEHEGGTGAVAYIYKVNAFTATDVTLTGNKSNNNGHLYVHTSTGVLDNVTATGNSARNGGVLYASTNSVLTLKNSVWSGNSATNSGGAIYLGAGTLTISNSTLGGNSAEKGNSAKNGGAVYAASCKQLTIEDSVFGYNTATESGGAIYAAGTSKVTVGAGTKATQFNNNSAPTAGAINIQGSAVVDVTGAVFDGNSATTSNGGAIRVGDEDSTAKLTITSTMLKNNSTIASGGALTTGTKCPAIEINAVDCTFLSNSSTGGGGALAVQNGNGFSNGDPDKLNIVFTNCVFESNSANANGGAVDIRSASYIKFDGVTAIKNSANDGGANGGFMYATSNHTRVYLTGTVVTTDNVATNGHFIRFNKKSTYSNPPKLYTTHGKDAAWLSQVHSNSGENFNMTTMP